MIRLLLAVPLALAAIWWTACIVVLGLLVCVRADTPADDLSGICCIALLLATLAALSHVQRWRS